MHLLYILFDVLSEFSIYADIIGLTIVFICLSMRYKKITSPFKNSMFVFYGIFFCLTALTTAFNIAGLKNNWIYDALPVLLMLPLYFFFQKLHETAFLKNFNKIYAAIYFLAAIFFWKNIIQLYLNPFFYLLFSFYILINSVGYLNEEMTSMRSENVFTKIEFWFITCLFFYAIICVIVWSLFSYLENNVSAQRQLLNPYYLWTYCHNSVLFIQSFVFSIVLVKNFVRK